METMYQISVNLHPDIAEEPRTPYFWALQSCSDGGDWCTETTGWAATCDEAWNEAYGFYKKHLLTKNRFVIVYPDKSPNGRYWEALYLNGSLVLTQRKKIELDDVRAVVDDDSIIIKSSFERMCADILGFCDLNLVPKTLDGMKDLIAAMWASINGDK